MYGGYGAIVNAMYKTSSQFNVATVRSLALAAAVLCFAIIIYPGEVCAAIWPGVQQVMEPSWAARAGARHRNGWIPPFRASPRDRWAAAFAAQWRPVSPVTLDLDWETIWDELPSGQRMKGPGDLRLGAHAWAWRSVVDLGLGWRVKLPNARDEGEIGSDETDVEVLGTVGRTWGHVRVMGVGGVAILGDPIRFANQDDVPIGWIASTGEIGPLTISGQVGGAFGTQRNPPRLSAVLGLEGQCPRVFGGDVQVGLTPAAPDWGAALWVGWAGGCTRVRPVTTSKHRATQAQHVAPPG